jgi:hypothetical protein
MAAAAGLSTPAKSPKALVAEPISHLPVSWFAPTMAVTGAVIVAA